jgi:DegV family protein with EDD domain
MPKFAIVADSCVDLPLKVAQKLDLNVVPMIVTIDDKTYRNFLDEREITTAQFNEFLRNKAKPKTSQPAPQEVMDVVEPLLKAGQDVLLMSISSNLSQTFNSMNVAKTELKAKYPKRRIELFDTLNASLGEGLLVHKALLLKNEEKTMDETLAYLNSIRNKVVAVVAFDDLSHLLRGGRINTVFIVHSDSAEDAKFLGDELKKIRPGIKTLLTNTMGPVIGAHGGLGTIGIMFVGKTKDIE